MTDPLIPPRPPFSTTAPSTGVDDEFDENIDLAAAAWTADLVLNTATIAVSLMTTPSIEWALQYPGPPTQTRKGQSVEALAEELRSKGVPKYVSAWDGIELHIQGDVVNFEARRVIDVYRSYIRISGKDQLWVTEAAARLRGHVAATPLQRPEPAAPPTPQPKPRVVRTYSVALPLPLGLRLGPTDLIERVTSVSTVVPQDRNPRWAFDDRRSQWTGFGQDELSKALTDADFPVRNFWYFVSVETGGAKSARLDLREATQIEVTGSDEIWVKGAAQRLAEALGTMAPIPPWRLRGAVFALAPAAVVGLGLLALMTDTPPADRLRTVSAYVATTAIALLVGLSVRSLIVNRWGRAVIIAPRHAASEARKTDFGAWLGAIASVLSGLAYLLEISKRLTGWPP